MAKYKVGVIGVGKLGGFHCNALSQIDMAELVGIFDTDVERRQEIAHKFQCKVFQSADDLVDSCEVVGVIVPTQSHKQIVEKALRAGKPVFVEKPIASTLEEAEEIVNMATDRNIPLQVGHIERFNPAIRALEGFDVNPMFIESHRLSPFDPRGTDVAVVLDLMIHDIDIISSLVQSPIEDIRANGVAIVSDEVDIANARLQFSNGCVANVTASRISQRKMRKMRLFQPNAYISIDFLQRLTEIFRISESVETSLASINLGQIEKGKHKKNIIYEKPQIPENDAMQAEWKSFFNALEYGTQPLVSGQDGLKALDIAMRIRNIIQYSSPSPK